MWKFRERIGEQGADSVFASVQRGLGRHGLIARKGQLIDASLVESPKQHFTKEEKEIVSEGAHPCSWTAPMRRQRDTEAQWTKKHAKSDYGYKLHVGVDNAYKLIRRLKVTPANGSDTRHFEGVLDPGNTSKSVYADRGYVDKERELRLKAQGMRVDIQRKAKANCPLSVAQGKRNHRIAKTRARVEHVFASMQAMGGKTVRSIRLRRARIALTLKASAYNLLRLVSLKKHGVVAF